MQGKASTSGATPGKAKGAKSHTNNSKSRKRAGADTERRIYKLLAVLIDAKSMAAAHAKDEGPRLKIAEEESPPDPELNGQDHGPSTVTPVMVDADAAAAMFSVSVRTWRRRDRDGSVPRGAMLKGRKLWRIQDLELWSEWGLPNRSTFDKRLRDQRSAARH